MRSGCTYPPAKFFKIMALSKRKQRPRNPQKPINGATSPTGSPSSFQPFNYQPPTPIQPPEPTLQPGQSVLPGSISLGGKPGTHTAKNPENIWWSYGEGTNALQLIWQLLNNSNNGGSLSQGYADILSQLTKQSEAGKPINPDMVISLLMNLLSYNTTQEQRDYDYRMLNESRQYNNPQNELARLMGAGISRDAALQLMSGSAGNLGSGSGAGATQMMSPVAGAGAAALNSSNAHNNLVNQVYNGIQLVANLFGQGVDMYSAIQSAQMLQAQNYMTQQQVGTYQQVNQITQALQNAVTQGILEPTDLEGWSNANDVYKWLIDHADTNLVKPLNNSGAISGVFGTTIGREMFNKHWQQMRDSKDAGKLFDNFVRQQELDTEMRGFDVSKSYFELQYAIGELSRQDVEIQNLWNAVWSGNIDLEIKGLDLKIKQYEENQARTWNDIFNETYNTEHSDFDKYYKSLKSNGKSFVAFDQYQNLFHNVYRAYVNGLPLKQDEWVQFYRDNRDAAFFAAGVKRQISEMQYMNITPENSPYLSGIISVYQMLKMSGALDVIEVGTRATAPFMPYMFTPNKPQ